MEYSNEKIKSLENQKVNMTFDDGCSMDLIIISTMHLDEGGDFVAEVIRTTCNNKQHNHHPIGTAINIRRTEIVDIKSR